MFGSFIYNYWRSKDINFKVLSNRWILSDMKTSLDLLNEAFFNVKYTEA